MEYHQEAASELQEPHHHFSDVLTMRPAGNCLPEFHRGSTGCSPHTLLGPVRTQEASAGLLGWSIQQSQTLPIYGQEDHLLRLANTWKTRAEIRLRPLRSESP